MRLLPPAKVIELARKRLDDARPIAIDGWAVAGKSTLASAIARELGLEVLGLDDFHAPRSTWPRTIAPAFPFPFFRDDELERVVRAVAGRGRATYRPHDWDDDSLGPPRTISGDRPVVVEGCSALRPSLAPLYALRIFVESDEASALDAALQRSSAVSSGEWRDLFLPSVARYFETNPRGRADLSTAGRGAELDVRV